MVTRSRSFGLSLRDREQVLGSLLGLFSSEMSVIFPPYAHEVNSATKDVWIVA